MGTELADRALGVGELAARRRGGVIDEEDAGRRQDAVGAELVDLLDRERAGAVLGDGHVDVADDDLAGCDRIGAGVDGEQPLGQREWSHSPVPTTVSRTPPLPIGTASPRRVM
jgi:hypothetical protein